MYLAVSLTDLHQFLYYWIALALLLFPIQLFVTAPYGRHTTKTWGPLMSNQWGWFVMEVISPILLLLLFLRTGVPAFGPEWIFVILWTVHYINRSIIFPLRTKTTGKKIPVLIVLFALFFNLVNAGTNGLYLGGLAAPYSHTWFSDPRFLIGGLLFLTGMGINFWSDNRLLNLRSAGDQGYYIPRGGLFRYISCPNLFGEILEWSGFAIMCWNLPALGFAVWTGANLIPRALSHHRWYQDHFPDYPSNRKAVIPFLV
jgi:3-oxo-5-alpha-steroid 4-dehydrogenase 1